MYKIQRKQTIKDELVICGRTGEEELVLQVNLRVDDVIAQYNRLRCLLGEAQMELQKDPNDEVCLAKYGYTVLALFEVVFGSEGAQKLVDYYENRYTEMLEDVAPFIVDRIQPQMSAAMKERAAKFQKIAKKIK